MIVMKFGGTSVGDAERFKATAETIRRFLPQNPVVVVSAVGGITNILDKAAHSAASGRNQLEDILAPHRRIIADLGLDPHPFYSMFELLRAELESVAMQGELTPQKKDYIHSFGERISVRILAALLNKNGLSATAYEAGDAGMITDANFGCACPLPESKQAIRNWLASFSFSEVIPIVTGYIGKTENGVMTTIGRGGSDMTAAWYAAALGASELQIWTDVTGVMTADPRLVPTARTIDTLSFDEASEMAFRGAKVLHKDTLRPVREAGIPVRVLNSFHPLDMGTMIVEKSHERGVKCCTSQHDLIVWSFIEEYGNPRNRSLRDALNVFERFAMPVQLMSSSESGFAIVTPYLPEYSVALAALAEFSRVSVSRGYALVSLVGEDCCRNDQIEIACNAMKAAEVEWKIVLSSATGRSFSFIMRENLLSTAVRALHAVFCR